MKVEPESRPEAVEGQMSIFDFLHDPQPGDWLHKGGWTMGAPLRFDELKEGMKVWSNQSTESMEWWKCLLVEKIIRDEAGKAVRAVMSKNKKDHYEYHSAYYQGFSKPMHGEYWYRRMQNEHTD